MTINKVANQDDVLYESDSLGWSAVLTSQPDEMFQHQNGDGSVVFGKQGLKLSAGTSSGSTASVSTVEHPSIDNITEIGVGMHFSINAPTPIENKYVMGVLKRTGHTDKNGAGLDFQSGQYTAGQRGEIKTEPATLPSQYDNNYLEVRVRPSEGVSHIKQSGDVNEKVTLQTAPRRVGELVRTEYDGSSTGGDEIQLEIQAMKYWMIP